MTIVAIVAIVASWSLCGYIVYRQHKAVNALLDLTAVMATNIHRLNTQTTVSIETIASLDKKLAETLKQEVTRLAFMGVKVR